MKVIAVNGSPRKKWNTATLLNKALEGAAAKGAETELVHLYELNYKGCVSCFGCKRKGGPSYGKCALRDGLTPLLDRIAAADALVVGSPVYLGAASGEVRSFLERLIFPYLVYDRQYSTLFPRKMPLGFIYTMGADEPEIHIWGRCSVRRDGKLLHVDRAFIRALAASSIPMTPRRNTTRASRSTTANDGRTRFVHLMGHTGNYTREEAITAIDAHRILPDILCFDPSKPAKYPNGRVFTDDVINHRLAFLSKGEIPPTGLKPHTDILKQFPYLGTPHQKKS